MELQFVKLSEKAIAPSKARDDDAGYDLFSVEHYYLKPFERKLFNTNIAVAIPKGFEGYIRGRSGKALKEGIAVLGGTIDACYRGPIGVILYNTDDHNSVEIRPGDKIAQMVISPYISPIPEEVDSLDSTDRNEKGFGSSGR